MNFLYCFDKNYNIQGFISIFSVLEHVDSKVNFFIIHKDKVSLEIFPKRIIEHENLNEIKIFHFEKNSSKFYNLQDAHVSEATFYRLFINDYINENIKNLVYLDADILCIGNPLEILNNEFSKLSKSNLSVGFNTEYSKLDSNHEAFKRLNLLGNKYFNAGVMLINFQNWLENKDSQNITRKIEEIKEKAIYWDQDILNSYFDGNYIEIPNSLNYKINYFDKDYKKILKDNISEQKIFFIHYSGKFKPWSVKGITHSSSYIFHDYYYALFEKKYFINNSRKILALKDFIKIVYTFKFLKLKYPFSGLSAIIKYLLS